MRKEKKNKELHPYKGHPRISASKANDKLEGDV